MKNIEYVKKLRALADKLEELGEVQGLEPANICIYQFNKETLASIIRALGGKWNKIVLCPDKDYSAINFTSEKYPVVITISRDRVCKKTINYDCEPIFAPGEDDALVEEVSK